MASGILYTYPENFRAYKALIAAQFSGTQIKVAQDFVFGETNKSEAFLKKFPLGKVPAFETCDGTYITESNAIAYYVANEQLRGKTDIERSLVIQWLGFADSEILPASCAWVFPLLGIMPYHKQTVEHAKEDINKALTALNSHLLTRTYLVGERLTLADICVAMTLLHLYQYILEPELRKPYQNVNRWFQTVIYQPESIAVIGAFKLADKTIEYDPKAETQGKSSKIEKKEKESKKKAKEQKEPKESKKESKVVAEKTPAVEDEADATEEALAAEPKKQNPFASMPKSSFDLDDFKRFYSNEDESKSIPYFWQKFDSENYSIWLSEYKYNNELTKVFMSCNLISGMYQRLYSLRKRAFASACIFGKDNDNTISGIWVWRGQDLVFTLSPDWQVDYESYSWTKLDPSKEETKELVKQYFSWTGTDKEGRKFNQGKVFKMDNGSSGSDKRNKTTKQLTPSTERKASGCNWKTYKNFFPNPKTKESTGEKSVSQNRYPKLKKVCTTPHHTVKEPQEDSGKHNAVKNKENKNTLTKQVAMDCEMVGIGDGTESMIARVSIVNKHGDCLYDKYVKPREKVVDYRTAISGIRPEHLQNGENFNVVQKEVADILKGRILVGHALKHDLNVLYLSHPRRYWRDTSRYKPFRQISKGNTPSLKKLAHELLGREIQVGEHSSVEDAKAAMQLYMLYKNKWESGRKH